MRRQGAYMAEKGWKENRPKMVKELKRRGLYEEVLMYNKKMTEQELAQGVRE